MARILGFRIKNFKSLKDVTLGQLAATKDNVKITPLSPLTAVIGKNGTGKSALLDIFGFLADCLKLGVEEACQKRGGYERIISQGQKGSIEFEIYYKEDGRRVQPMTYNLCINLNAQSRPYVAEERLSQENGNGEQDVFLQLKGGKGRAWSAEKAKANSEKNDTFSEEFQKELEKYLSAEREKGRSKPQAREQLSANIDTFIKEFISARKYTFNNKDKTETVELADKGRLGLATWGAFKENPRIVAFREFMEGWYLSYFAPDAARALPFAEPQTRLSKHGGNLANVAQFMEKNHPQEFKAVLANIAEKIPGIDKISTQTTADGRLLLRFNDRDFKDPFFAPQMSDGTLKLFAYLLMLAIPNPPPFICVEEPENGLYHKLLESLVSEFRNHAKKEKGGSQIFVSTHQPYILDALNPEEVWILKKRQNGFSTIERVSDNETVKNLVAEELPLGGLWNSEYLD